MSFESIILAAGRGARMKSAVSKVLHDFAGRKIVYFPVRAVLESGTSRVIVVCSEENRNEIETYLVTSFGRERITCAVQVEPRGTGDAARVGIQGCLAENVCILCADTPLVEARDLAPMVGKDTASTAFSVLSCHLEDPTGYGRIVRDACGQISAIREHRDASAAERRVTEVNAGIYFADTNVLRQALLEITPNNDQSEYYLTDVVAILAPKCRIDAELGAADTLLGINDREQLEVVERRMLARIRTRLRRSGVTIRGDARIEDDVEIGQDCVIEAGVQLRGRCRIGSGTHVDVGSVLVNATIGQNTRILPYTIVVDSSVGDAESIGPFHTCGRQASLKRALL